MAFILAGLIFFSTLVVCGIMLFAAGMSDSPSAAADVPVTSTFFMGIILAALTAASHWLPHIGW